jgi:alpha-galactosidase
MKGSAIMNKNIALTPPMGWNSWDCYGASVREDEIRGNAKYMAKYLKPFGWEYIVVDIQWYEPGAYSSSYRPFVPLEIDECSRLIPAVNRFPSAADGKGFKPLADYVHSLGLKFGIHIMRGIPRQAVHANTPILGTTVGARDIASTSSICTWNTDMYGVNYKKDGAQQYYNSLFELYASWGVDYVKVDDIASTNGLIDKYSGEGEIELIRNAIDNCGREMVLSLSPGPAPIDKAEHLKSNATMWRITNDYWDRWEDLLFEFDQCNLWSSHVGPGHWPDADMLPIGHIGIRSCEHGFGDRWTKFSKDEQITMMTLWCIFRSPLMIGCEMRDNDEWTLSLLTNSELLRVLNNSHSGRQLFRKGNNNELIAWTAEDEDGSYYLALFNTGITESKIEVELTQLGLTGTYKVRDLWEHKDLSEVNDSINCSIASHGARLLKLNKA